MDREKQLNRKRLIDKYVWPMVPAILAVLVGVVTTIVLL